MVCFHRFADAAERTFWAIGFPCLFDHAADRCAADAVSRGDLGLAHAAVAENGGAVDVEWGAANLPALQPGASHAGPDPLDTKVTFQFRDGADGES